MATASEIKNLSLFELGWDTNVDFTGSDKIAILVDKIYTQELTTILGQYNWSFQTLVEKNTTATSVDDKEYNYRYDLPDDFLKLVNVYYDSRQNQPKINYSIDTINGYIYVDNSNGIFVKYLSSTITEANLPFYFIEYFVYALASKLCMSVIGDKDMLQILEAKRDREKRLAFKIDGNNVKPKRIKGSDKYIAIRR